MGEMESVKRGRDDRKRMVKCSEVFGFFFNDTATTEIYTLSLHDALPIWIYRYRIGILAA